jgi:hypothetical protein
MNAVTSALIPALKLLRFIPVVIAGIVLSGRGLSLFVQPYFWLALIVAPVLVGTLAHGPLRAPGRRR